MSQFMNLSSSEDDDSSSASSESSKSSTGSDIVRAQSLERSTESVHGIENNNSNHDDGNDDEDDDEFDDVDWEDADIDDVESHNNEQEQHEESNNAVANTPTPIVFPCKAVTIHLDNPASPPSFSSQQSTTTQNKKRKRQFRKIQNVSSGVKGLVLAVYRAHMLSWTSRIIHISSHLRFPMPSCSCNHRDDVDIWCVAHSLIPLDILDANYQLSSSRRRDEEQQSKKIRRHTKNGVPHQDTEDVLVVVPPIALLKRFCAWFFDFINHCSQRRQRIRASNIAAGAPPFSRRRRRGGKRLSSRLQKQDKQDENKRVEVVETSTDSMSNGAKRGTTIYNYVVRCKIQRLLHILDYLSPTNDERLTNDTERCIISSVEKNLIFVCMTRSMGWRVRYVQAIDPMERDLTVDHPLFSLGVTYVLQCIVKGSPLSPTKANGAKKRKRKRTKTVANAASMQNSMETDLVNEGTSCDESQFTQDHSWIEVLCLKAVNVTSQTITTSNARILGRKSRWAHIDPHHELFDKPLAAESIYRQRSAKLKSTTTSTTRTTNALTPFSFILAVEHFSDSTIERTRSSLDEGNEWTSSYPNTSSSAFATMCLTDVTPRYSNKWSLALRLRGATAKDISTLGGRCANVWWADTIQKANQRFGKRGEKVIPHHGANKPRSKTRCIHGPSKAAYVVEKSESGKTILVKHDLSDEQILPPQMIGEHNASDNEDVDSVEEDELIVSRENESIPTSRTAFKNHPLFVIPSTLKHQEVLFPDSKNRICGIFKGEMVYKRADVSMALVPKNWLYKGRKVRHEEITKPAKRVKARKKPTKIGFQAMASYGVIKADQADTIITSGIGCEDENGNSRLYGVWQTNEWSPPPIGLNDNIPVNKHNNVELALLNPGLIHLRLHRIATVAKKLGIPYAPCLLGFEGYGGNLAPTIRGIVIHQHNADMLREAHTEWESQTVEIEYRKHQEKIHLRWRRIVIGIMTKERLEREYAKD